MPYLGDLRSPMLEQAKSKATFVGLYTAESATAGWSSTNNHTLHKGIAHGYNTGDLVYIKTLSSGGSGLVKTGQFFWVKKATTEDIELSMMQTESNGTGFVQVTWTVEISGTVELQKCTELVTEYARKATGWGGSITNALLEDSNSHSIGCAEGASVDCVSYHSASTAGTLYAIEKVTNEKVGASKAYVVSNSKLDLLTQ